MPTLSATIDEGCRATALSDLLELERLMQRPHRLTHLTAIDDARDVDLARRDHLDVDPRVGERAEDPGEHARRAANTGAHDADLRYVGCRRIPLSGNAAGNAREHRARAPQI